MSLYSSIARRLGIISVAEKQGVVWVSGIDTVMVLDQISKLYGKGGNKIGRYMFKRLQRNDLWFCSFFIIELHYIFTNIKINAKTWRARRMAVKVLKEIEENTWFKNTTDENIPSIIDLSQLNQLLWTPLQHQLDFLDVFGKETPRMQLNGYLLAAPPGSGKSFLDICVATCVIPKSIAEVKIIISPKNAVDLVWTDTIKKVFRTPPTYWTSETTGPAPLGMEYYVFHYESLSRAEALAKQLIEAGIKYFTIIDESHNFNTDTSIRTQDLVVLCTMQKGQSYSIWASGSPIKALGTECIPFLKSVDPKFTKEVEIAFRRIFGGDVSSATEILYHRLGKVTFKIPKSVVIDTTPTVYRRRVKLKNSDRYLISTVRTEMKAFIEERVAFYRKDMTNYKAVFEECLAYHKKKLTRREDLRLFDEYVKTVNLIRANNGGWALGKEMAFCKDYEKRKLMPSLPADLQRKFRNTRSIVKTLLLKVRGEALGRILGRRRAECAAELARHCNLQEIVNEAIGKTLVFSTYVEAVHSASKYLQDLGYDTRSVYGETNKDVTKIINDFTNIEEINPVCATYMSLSTAVPVTVANTICLLDLPVRQYLYSQVVSRCDRIGQKNPVVVYEITLDTGNEPNISTRSADILTWSRDQVASLLGEDYRGPNEEDYEIEDYDSGATVEKTVIVA